MYKFARKRQNLWNVQLFVKDLSQLHVEHKMDTWNLGQSIEGYSKPIHCNQKISLCLSSLKNSQKGKKKTV